MSDSKIKTEVKSKRQVAQEERVCVWRDHIRGWLESGLSQAGYCREHGLKENAFTYWKGKLTKGTLPGRSGTVYDSSSICLVPIGVKVNRESVSQGFPVGPKPLVLVIDDRFRIEVSGDFEPGTLGKLVSTLRQV